MPNKKILILLGMFVATPVSAGVLVVINKTTQTMNVFLDKQPIYTWKVSTARPGYRTPTGSFSPIYLQKMHFSKKYDNSPMPNSIFFKAGYAIHGTNHISGLGTPRSHGCVRLHPENAKKLYGLVSSNPTVIQVK